MKVCIEHSDSFNIAEIKKKITKYSSCKRKTHILQGAKLQTSGNKSGYKGMKTMFLHQNGKRCIKHIVKICNEHIRLIIFLVSTLSQIFVVGGR